MKTPPPVVVIGSGPTGIGAAIRLSELGVPWLILERETHPGGLSASFSSEGFTWDIGGHVIFSHYDAYDDLLLRSIPSQHWLEHPRDARIRFRDSWVPYPFQRNLDALPDRERAECDKGLRDVAGETVDRTNFSTFIQGHFGTGITRHFMRPYNEKIWAHPLEKMSVNWIGERVATASREVKTRRPAQSGDRNWGPNSQFRFPAAGGTGEIWRKAAGLLEPSRVRYRAEVRAIDAPARRLTINGGEQLDYHALVSSIPLDQLARMVFGDDGVRWSAGLHHSSVHVVGLGMSGQVTPAIRDVCWMYFPDPDIPFYRATVFSRYSPANAPAGHWSLMLEVSESRHRPVETPGLVDRCIAACHAAGILTESSSITHRWHHRTEYGYPIPTLDRDSSTAVLHRRLEDNRIFSRGRFGAWMYEVGNMDHSYMQGREVADRIVANKAEITINHPDRINHEGGGRRS